MTSEKCLGKNVCMCTNCDLDQNTPFAFVIVHCDIIFLRHLCVDLVECDFPFCPNSYELYPTNSHTKQWATPFLVSLSFSITCFGFFSRQILLIAWAVLANIFNEEHWNLVHIVFREAKLKTGKHMFRTQLLCPAGKNVLRTFAWFFSKNFIIESWWVSDVRNVRKMGGHRLRLGETMPGRTPKSEQSGFVREEGHSRCKSQNIAIRALKENVLCQIWFKWTY